MRRAFRRLADRRPRARTCDEVNPRGRWPAGERPALQRFVRRRNVGASSRSPAARCCESLPIASKWRNFVCGKLPWPRAPSRASRRPPSRRRPGEPDGGTRGGLEHAGSGQAVRGADRHARDDADPQLASSSARTESLTDSGGRRRRERRPGNTMKNFSLVALGATAIMTVCVAYPVDTYHDGGDRSAPRDNDRRCDPATIAATNGVSATTETARQRPGW